MEVQKTRVEVQELETKEQDANAGISQLQTKTQELDAKTQKTESKANQDEKQPIVPVDFPPPKNFFVSFNLGDELKCICITPLQFDDVMA